MLLFACAVTAARHRVLKTFVATVIAPSVELASAALAAEVEKQGWTTVDSVVFDATADARAFVAANPEPEQ